MSSVIRIWPFVSLEPSAPRASNLVCFGGERLPSLLQILTIIAATNSRGRQLEHYTVAVLCFWRGVTERVGTLSLTELGQHGSVWWLASVNTSITVLTVSKVTNVQREDVQSLQSLAEEYYYFFSNDGTMDSTMDSAWTDREVHHFIDIWADEDPNSPGIS